MKKLLTTALLVGTVLTSSCVLMDVIKDGYDKWQHKEDKQSESLPWAGKSVKLIKGDNLISKWPVTIDIVDIVFNGNTVHFNYGENTPESRGWAPTHKISKSPIACPTWVTEVSGKWYQGTGEWLPHNCRVHNYHIFTKAFKNDLAGWVPPDGHVFYVAVSGLNMVGQANVQERSRFVAVVYKR